MKDINEVARDIKREVKSLMYVEDVSCIKGVDLIQIRIYWDDERLEEDALENVVSSNKNFDSELDRNVKALKSQIKAMVADFLDDYLGESYELVDMHNGADFNVLVDLNESLHESEDCAEAFSAAIGEIEAAYEKADSILEANPPLKCPKFELGDTLWEIRNAIKKLKRDIQDYKDWDEYLRRKGH